MPDIDRILEAEKSIQGIAIELKRMRDAASLMEDAQTRTDAVLTSAERVVQAAEQFSNACEVIVDKLSSTDLIERIEELHSEAVQISALVKEGTSHTHSAIVQLEKRSGSVIDQLQSVSIDVNKRLDSIRTEVESIATSVKEDVKNTSSAVADIELKLGDLDSRLHSALKGSKVRQITTLVFAIITTLTALVILTKILIPNLGG